VQETEHQWLEVGTESSCARVSCVLGVHLIAALKLELQEVDIDMTGEMEL